MVREAGHNLSLLTLHGNFYCPTIEHIALHRLNESLYPIMENMNIFARNLEMLQSSGSQIVQSHPELHDSVNRLQSTTQHILGDLNDLCTSLWDL